jgi:ABC-type nitrate/sulfonate/bicarbonate transport system permease component
VTKVPRIARDAVVNALVVVAVLLASWFGLGMFVGTDSYVYRSPADVVRHLSADDAWDLLGPSLAHTALACALGLALALLVAVLLAVAATTAVDLCLSTVEHSTQERFTLR